MKKYQSPQAELLLLASDAVMVSDENETPKDHVDGNGLIISGIEDI